MLEAIDQRADDIVGLGELDALVVPGHPLADPDTGAAHACGHNAQVAGLLGATMDLLDAGALDHLAGRPVFFAVPAEEHGDIEWRVGQARAGRLEFLGGKPELLRLGHFDDVDLATMIRATPRPGDGTLSVPVSSNGCIVKTVRYRGRRAAHAGGAPHLGVNALYAAQIGLLGINAVRETFKDDDTIRVRTVEAIMDADARVDRALRAGALALGATVEIETLPGYMPLACDPITTARFKEVAAGLVGAEHVKVQAHRTSSTDMGDLSQVMPALHPYVDGSGGTSHGADYEIAEPVLVSVTLAKALAATAVDMLAEGATAAREVVASARPPMTREQYLSVQRAIARTESYDGAKR